MKTTFQSVQPASIAAIYGGSVSAYDRVHVEDLVVAIVKVAMAYVGGSVRLHGVSLPFENQSEAPDGYMEFTIEKDGQPPIAFSIEFGSKEHDRLRFDGLTLNELRARAEDGDAVNLMATVLNFDELWLFANMLVERMSLSSISIAFGGLGGL